jgi:hypothetical protein
MFICVLEQKLECVRSRISPGGKGGMGLYVNGGCDASHCIQGGHGWFLWPDVLGDVRRRPFSAQNRQGVTRSGIHARQGVDPSGVLASP